MTCLMERVTISLVTTVIMEEESHTWLITILQTGSRMVGRFPRVDVGRVTGTRRDGTIIVWEECDTVSKVHQTFPI